MSTLTSNEIDPLVAEADAALSLFCNGTWKGHYAANRFSSLIRKFMAERSASAPETPAPSSNPKLPPEAPRMTPTEADRLIEWHQMAAQVSEQTDDFAGARWHREKLAAWRAWRGVARASDETPEQLPESLSDPAIVMERVRALHQQTDAALWLLRYLNRLGGLGQDKHRLIDAVLEGRAKVLGDTLHIEQPSEKALEPRCECGISEVWPDQFNPNCPRHKHLQAPAQSE